MLSKLEEAVADEPVAPVGEKNGVAASKMEAAAVGAAAPAKTAAVAVAQAPKKAEKKKVEVEEEKVAVSEPPLNFDRLKSVGTFVRTLEIWGFVFNFLFRRVAPLELFKFTYKGAFTEAKKLERTEALAKWLRLGLLRLGPTFIKIGQQFSTRVDVLAKAFIRVTGEAPGPRASRSPPRWPSRSSKRNSMAAPIDEVYTDFQDEALAAASLGQVHLAKLKATGEQVIVKVQRPGLACASSTSTSRTSA